MKIVLDEYQRKVIDCKTNIALRAGRQVGKSTCIAHLAGEYAVKNQKKTIMVIASVERQAFLLFEKILFFLEDYYKPYIMQGKDRPTKSRVRLKNGSEIYCLPTGLSGTGIRGYTIDLLIADEAAFIEDEVFQAVTPALAAREGARIILLSTPFGRRGYFYKCFNDPTFTTFHISSEECPRITKEFLAQERARMTKLQYAQEYMGEWVDELQQFFPDELIKRAMKTTRPNHIDKTKAYYLGVDLARMGADESTFAIGYLTDNKNIIQVENQITTRTYLNESAKHIIQLNKLYDFQKILIDDEGIGVGVYDFLMDNEETKRKLVAINNSKRVIDYHDETKTRILKEDLYNNLLRCLESGQISLLEDPEIFLSLKSVQYEYTSDKLGKPHLKIFGSYTHIAEALIRLAWCLKYKSLNIWISSI